MKKDPNNEWFCFLTDSCVPLISPLKFRELFFNNYNQSIINWKKAWWNINIHKRANLHLLKEDFRLANDPWFILKREDVKKCLYYSNINQQIFKIICKGGLANESIFAIILYTMKSLANVKREVTHCVDWNRMTSRTSPHIFKDFSKRDLDYINDFLRENKYTMFLRKVDPTFPDDILLNYIYNQDIEIQYIDIEGNQYNNLVQKRKYHLKILEYKIYFMRFIKKNFFSLILLIAYYYFYKFVLLEKKNNK